MISRTDTVPTQATKRLGDLRRQQPADATLKNLLRLLDAKLDLCASLPVYEWEAGTEGFDDCAAAFREFAQAEHESCAHVIERLREHLDRRTDSPRDPA